MVLWMGVPHGKSPPCQVWWSGTVVIEILCLQWLKNESLYVFAHIRHYYLYLKHMSCHAHTHTHIHTHTHTEFPDVNTIICRCVAWRTLGRGHTCLQEHPKEITKKFLPVHPKTTQGRRESEKSANAKSNSCLKIRISKENYTKDLILTYHNIRLSAILFSINFSTQKLIISFL